MSSSLFDGPVLAWSLLAGFLVVGLVIYERTGSRLGGVLVLPLLLVYALVDLAILLVFSLASLASFVLGQVLYSRFLVYGRRLLYVFLLSGMGATFVAYWLLRPESFGLVLAVLPGLFSYNLHREGRFIEGMSTFVIWFGLLLVLAVGVLWVVSALEPWGRATGAVPPGVAAFAASIPGHAASLTTALGRGLDALLAGGVTLAAAASAVDGGAE